MQVTLIGSICMRQVCSAGSLHTPALLLRSGITARGNVGKNLRLHPATCITGVIPQVSTAALLWAVRVLLIGCTNHWSWNEGLLTCAGALLGGRQAWPPVMLGQHLGKVLSKHASVQ